jgi:hypothetical protein
MHSYLSDSQRGQYAGRVRYWCADESRAGLLTVTGRKLTGLGVKPIGEVQWQFLYRWLYGVVEPLSSVVSISCWNSLTWTVYALRGFYKRLPRCIPTSCT